jgi:integral membrane protein (TIGR01906 family)
MKITKIIISIAIMLVVIFSPLFLLMNNIFLSHEFNKQSIGTTSLMSKSDYLFYTDQVIRYFSNNDSRISIQDRNGSRIGGFFTEEEILHMIDVKKIFRFVFILLIISLIVLFVLWKKIRLRFVLNSLILSFIILSILGTILYFNFDRSFYIFHKILFRNQYWLLPQDDMLIRMFPEGFFYDYAITWFIISCFPGLIIVIFKIFGTLRKTS